MELQKNNPLHGIKLADILSFLVEKYGWVELGRKLKSEVLMRILQ